jgi:hypothetical protein
MKGRAIDTVGHSTDDKLLNVVYMPSQFLTNCLKSNSNSHSTSIQRAGTQYLRGKFTTTFWWQTIPKSQYTYAVNINEEIYIMCTHRLYTF